MPALVLTELGGPSDGPTLLVGPSLGTDVRGLWSPVVPHLGHRWRVLGWDLPGHGASPTATGFNLHDLADELLATVPGDFPYAGVSAGGAVGLELALAAPDRVTAAVLLCTGARIGTPQDWVDRAELVEREGTAAVAAGSAQRWFAPGFSGGSELLDALRAVDDAGYAATCHALARYDVRHLLAGISVPLTAVAGSEDVATPVATLEEVAREAPLGQLVVIEGAAHLPTVERPREVADILMRTLRVTGV